MANINVKVGINRTRGVLCEKVLGSIDDCRVVMPPSQKEMVALKLRAAISSAKHELNTGYRFGDILQSFVLEDMLQHIKNWEIELDVHSDREDINYDICFVKRTDIASLCFYKDRYGAAYYDKDTVNKVFAALTAAANELYEFISAAWEDQLVIVQSDYSNLSYVVPMKSVLNALMVDHIEGDVAISCDGFSCTILTPPSDVIYNLLDKDDKWCLSATYSILACLTDQGDIVDA